MSFPWAPALLALYYSILAVLSLRFPQGWVPMGLGKAIDIGVLRDAMFLAMAIAGGLAIANLIQGLYCSGGVIDRRR
mgnify:CR=1 FL=1